MWAELASSTHQRTCFDANIIFAVDKSQHGNDLFWLSHPVGPKLWWIRNTSNFFLLHRKSARTTLVPSTTKSKWKRKREERAVILKILFMYFVQFIGIISHFSAFTTYIHIQKYTEHINATCYLITHFMIQEELAKRQQKYKLNGMKWNENGNCTSNDKLCITTWHRFGFELPSLQFTRSTPHITHATPIINTIYSHIAMPIRSDLIIITKKKWRNI